MSRILGGTLHSFCGSPLQVTVVDLQELPRRLLSKTQASLGALHVKMSSLSAELAMVAVAGYLRGSGLFLRVVVPCAARGCDVVSSNVMIAIEIGFSIDLSVSPPSKAWTCTPLY